MLSRTLVDERLIGGESTPAYYFFFKDNEDQNRASTAICALLHQLFCSREPLFLRYAVPIIKKNGPGLLKEFEELWQLFIAAATDPEAGDVLCVLDALDECREDDRQKLIGRLEALYTGPAIHSGRGSRLKFLITSRPYRHIEIQFSKLAKEVPTIRLAGEEESDAISHEIGIVIRAKVEEIGEQQELDKSVQSSLEQKLVETPNRTYLWLKLIWEEISNVLSIREEEFLEGDSVPVRVRRRVLP